MGKGYYSSQYSFRMEEDGYSPMGAGGSRDWKQIEARLKEVERLIKESNLQRKVRKITINVDQAEEKVQKQLAKEEKERIAEFKRSTKNNRQRERKDAEALKKRREQEDQEARDAEKQLKDERKAMQQKLRTQQVVFTIPEEPTGVQNREVEEGVVKSASGRPQRTRNTPKRFHNSVIVIE
ncbi:hypothetical protein BU16DRAFT_536921 [Lophium mytilinum]|uniref:Uncharacterized protein n=1 Tax=Lophium mytilinum TaxID=390894 RepID=A0A6A6R2K1_9PEZI|nr:hypothetical protein BU16DRAFT_536921 [Lophium mytilinum]